MAENSQSRKWQITIQDPVKNKVSDEYITEQLLKFVPDYYCMCKEIGNKTKREHIHIFIYSKSPIRFTTLKNRFPMAHLEKAYGTIKENIDYIRKEGKWKGTSKEETTIEGSFVEFGVVPTELVEKDATMGQLLENIKNGKSIIEIIEDNPQLAFRIRDIETIRQTYLNEKFSRENRDIICTYIFGESGIGKTFSIFKKYGAENIARITNYNSSNGIMNFDNYDKSQDVLVFEEFHSQISIENMLNYLDVYPIKLPARYNNKVACYTKVYITSNVPFESQYAEYKMDLKKYAVYQAWCRRIHNIYEMVKDQDGKTKIIVHKETKKEEEKVYE